MWRYVKGQRFIVSKDFYQLFQPLFQLVSMAIKLRFVPNICIFGREVGGSSKMKCECTILKAKLGR